MSDLRRLAASAFTAALAIAASLPAAYAQLSETAAFASTSFKINTGSCPISPI